MSKRWIGMLLIIAGLVDACSPFPSPTPTAWQQTVDALNALKPGEIPAHLQKADAIRDGSEFDPNRYFTVLTHLSLEVGYTLDYVYYFDGMGGLPVLYARPADQPPYRNYSEYQQAVGTVGEQRSSYLDHVHSDGSAEGYFELVVLRIHGSQFYLFWHANYNDTQIVGDRVRLEAIIRMIQESGQGLSADLLRQARAIDLEPRVEFQGDKVRVRVVTFTRWGGFSEEIYLLRKDFPHQLLEEETKTLVPYECGIMF